jgi:glutaredoxin
MPERMAAAKLVREPLKVYWQPGCSSCLRTKEFLTRHGVDFVSVNVMADEQGFAELAELGLRQIPIVRRGNDWVNGQVIRDVARIAGIDLGTQSILPPAEIVRRLDIIMESAQGSLRQLPARLLDSKLPNDRPQTYRELACHVFQITDAFLNEVEHGRRLEFADYAGVIPSEIDTREKLLAFGDATRARLAAWWAFAGKTTDFSRRADVYYGEQTLHEFLERTGWHSAQHARQLAMIIETEGMVPLRKLTEQDLAGLPVPQNVWDDKLVYA